MVRRGMRGEPSASKSLEIGDVITPEQFQALSPRGPATPASAVLGPTAWFCVYTAPKVEEVVGAKLEDGGFDAYVATGRQIRKKRVRNKGWRPIEVRRPVFPRYVFVGFSDGRPNWMKVRAVNGVQAVVCEGNTPLRIEQNDIDDMRMAQDIGGFDWDYREPMSAKFHVETNDHVQITTGALSGYSARVLKTPTSHKVRVVPDIFPTRTVLVDVRDLKIVP